MARCAGIKPAAADTTASRIIVAAAIQGSRASMPIELRSDEPPECHRGGNADRTADRKEQQHLFHDEPDDAPWLRADRQPDAQLFFLRLATTNAITP
jgi:hypothetical protein